MTNEEWLLAFTLALLHDYGVAEVHTLLPFLSILRSTQSWRCYMDHANVSLTCCV